MNSRFLKPFSLTIATLILAGGVAGTMPASAAQGGIFSGFQQRLQSLDLRGQPKTGAAGYDQPVPQGSVNSGSVGAPAPVQLAQSDASFRVNELEEQMRVLNGKIEEMTFQLLQLQEQIRKMQEDNEFRFQELEDRSDAGDTNRNTASAGDNGLGKSQPSEAPTAGNGGESDGNRKSITELLQGGEGTGEPGLGEPPSALGTLTFDENGNLVDSNIGKPLDLTRQLDAPRGMPGTPEEMFDLGYQYVQGGDYEQAGQVFRQYISDYPTSPRDAEARFWLGESLFAQGDYEASARVFLDNHKAHPQGALAAQNLLKLGVSLSGLEQRELACATFAEVPKKYPDLSSAMRKRVAVEQQAAKCKNG